MDIAAKLRCSKTAVCNATVKFNADDWKRFGLPRKTTLREECSVRHSNALTKELMK